MKIEKILYEKEALTIEQLKELEEAKKYPIVLICFHVRTKGEKSL